MSLSTLRKVFSFGKAPVRGAVPRRRSALRFESLEDRTVPATINVGAADSINAAIANAKSGDTIKVSGVHAEQVVIAGDATHNLDNLKLVAANSKAAIQAPATMSSTGAIIEVTGAKNVTISGFTISSTVPPSSDKLVGVLVDGNGSAKILNNHITGINDNPFSGVQRGAAITVGTDTPGTATIVGNRIDKYQKDGIDVVGVGSHADIFNNEVRGAGPTAIIAQNGITVLYGASADVECNLVTGNVYTGGGYISMGILVTSAGNVTVSGNSVTRNQAGIVLETNTSTAVIDGNRVEGNTENGIVVDWSKNATVSNNYVTRNGSGGAQDGGIGIFASQNIVVVRNTSTANKGDGILVDGTSTGNTILSNYLLGNSNYDAEDQSTGSGTAGTANTWTKNQGKTSTPNGLVSKVGRFHYRFDCGRR